MPYLPSSRSEAGPLDPAERQLGTVETDPVDVDHPRIEAVRQVLLRKVAKKPSYSRSRAIELTSGTAAQQ